MQQSDINSGKERTTGILKSGKWWKRRRIHSFRWLTYSAAFVVIVTVVMGSFAPLFTSYDPTLAVPADRLLKFGEEGHLLGTDLLGRDVFARLVYGARMAWVVGAVVSGASLVIGSALGAVAGYFGGWFDNLISRFVDATLAFPALLLALVLAAIYGPSTGTAIIALLVAYTPLVARVMRAAVLSERSLEYVSASRGLGNPELVTLVRHVLPNTIGPMLVVATIVASRAIIVESSLSFLGAGTQAPTPDWGIMIRDARELILQLPNLVIVPAVTLGVTVLSINLVADALGDHFHTQSAADGVDVTTGGQTQ